MKKSILVTIMLLSITSLLQAQSIRFGIKGGINYANQNGTSITVNSKNFNTTEAITSYHAGLVSEIKLFDRFAIQPELLYSTQGATYKNVAEEFKNELGYLSIPVLAKIYLSKSLSLEVGPQASFLLSERNDFDYKNSETFEFAAVGGLGLNITKNLFIQARYGLGLTEASKDADIKNSTFQVSAGIMF
ncbi:porin family protein [Flavobacterium undicola]|uniref:porin family protein n=1 Tax=Flavobacterium undicola TaxID=1932779 RepID=UPI001378B43E|nr:porin family protein [Flavobacterium undicola]MBA0884120.1 PorT family protein [Flavobacterium undicola]